MQVATHGIQGKSKGKSGNHRDRNVNRGWRHGSAVRACCSSTGPGFGSQHPRCEFTAACNPSSKDSDALFWHLWAPTLICTRTTETREKKILNANESSKFSYDDFGAPPPLNMKHSIILNSVMTFCSSLHMPLPQGTSQSEL